MIDKDCGWCRKRMAVVRCNDDGLHMYQCLDEDCQFWLRPQGYVADIRGLIAASRIGAFGRPVKVVEEKPKKWRSHTTTYDTNFGKRKTKA